MKGLSLHISVCRLLSWLENIVKAALPLSGGISVFCVHNRGSRGNILKYHEDYGG